MKLTNIQVETLMTQAADKMRDQYYEISQLKTQLQESDARGAEMRKFLESIMNDSFQGKVVSLEPIEKFLFSSTCGQSTLKRMEAMEAVVEAANKLIEEYSKNYSQAYKYGRIKTYTSIYEKALENITQRHDEIKEGK